MAVMSNTVTEQPPLPVWTIDDRLAKAREFAGLSQLQMATELGISRRSIVRHETSGRAPRAVVLAYAAVTKVPIAWIEGRMQDTMPNTQRYSASNLLTSHPTAA